MPWSIQWTDQALGDIEHLDRTVARRVVAKLEEAARNPLHFFSRLKGSDDWKLRIGDYRLLAVLSHENQLIEVERVGHRRPIYDR